MFKKLRFQMIDDSARAANAANQSAAIGRRADGGKVRTAKPVSPKMPHYSIQHFLACAIGAASAGWIAPVAQKAKPILGDKNKSFSCVLAGFIAGTWGSKSCSVTAS
jgi:hypothetical protein